MKQLRPRWPGPLCCPPVQGFFELLKREGSTREDHLEGDAQEESAAVRGTDLPAGTQ